MNKSELRYYYLGQRDMLAMVLSENFKKIKLKNLAIFYEKKFQEKHFSHDWHVK